MVGNRLDGLLVVRIEYLQCFLITIYGHFEDKRLYFSAKSLTWAYSGPLPCSPLQGYLLTFVSHSVVNRSAGIEAKANVKFVRYSMIKKSCRYASTASVIQMYRVGC